MAVTITAVELRDALRLGDTARGNRRGNAVACYGYRAGHESRTRCSGCGRERSGRPAGRVSVRSAVFAVDGTIRERVSKFRGCVPAGSVPRETCQERRAGKGP